MTPRPYISASQLHTLEYSMKKDDGLTFIKEYIHDEKKRVTKNMGYGSRLAEGLERGEATGDPLLDLIMARLPKFDRMDLPVEAKSGKLTHFHRNGEVLTAQLPILKDEKGDIPLLALPDTAKNDYSAFKEYKTSVRKWTQHMVDESDQLTFYVTAIWLATGKIPKDVELICATTEYAEDGSLRPTGEIFRFPTKRTMVDVLKMTKRIRSAWSEIKKLTDKELL